MLAIARASFRSITRSPSAVVFTLLFPLIFILVFGFLTNRGFTLDLGIHSGSDKKNEIYEALKSTPQLRLHESETDTAMYSSLEKGRIDAVLNIRLNPDTNGPKYILELQTSEAAADNSGILNSVLENIVNKINLKQVPRASQTAYIQQTLVPGRRYSGIDFILPGQLGFSILSTGVFGTAFVFFNLRQTLVVKRFSPARI